MVNNKVALITGASRGIGRGIALQLADMGYTIIINYNNDRASAEQVLKTVLGKKGNGICFNADISKNENIEKMFKFISQEYGRLDVLINNAGYAPIIETEKIDEKSWDHILSINLKSAFFCSNHAMFIMKKAGQGKIINIGSQAGITGGFHSAAHYAIAKGGINTLTKRLAMEGAPYNILVNCVSPGIIETDGVNAYPEEVVKYLVGKIPIGRIGTVSDVANVVSFLLTEKSNYLTGINIPVNGGIYMN